MGVVALPGPTPVLRPGPETERLGTVQAGPGTPWWATIPGLGNQPGLPHRHHPRGRCHPGGQHDQGLGRRSAAHRIQRRRQALSQRGERLLHRGRRGSLPLHPRRGGNRTVTIPLIDRAAERRPGSPRRILVVYGTRPEAVKMAPLVHALQHSADFEPIVAVTGQHRAMLDQVNEVFGITPDIDLDIHSPGQTLTEITARTLAGITPVIEQVAPDAVAVQGDTTTTYAVALAAFYAQVPVVHLEAGLRTHDLTSPFPEELNRRQTTMLSDLHLAPTAAARANLVAEDVSPDAVVVTGNTVIDALHQTLASVPAYGDDELERRLAGDARVLLVTAHRRESWGEPMQRIGRALARLARRYPDLLVVFPAHRNPLVREAILPHLDGLANVVITEPLPYGGFCRLLQRASIVLTDSGGVQEEAPGLGKPVLVLRETTERPEAVHAGTVRLIGTDEDAVVDAVCTLHDDPAAYASMAHATNPYGDGQAARRSVEALAHFFGRGERPTEFDPARPVRIELPDEVADLAGPPSGQLELLPA
ncbi:MAG: UDP-N-acetylglucosamine 2-epimerase (non-hydrolyzing) [Kineosporiaceae bacterium]|nr:UDP-N-acetylglucosamine 2-epimerase (non-hydrolyzing) [Kineosporiaceae bacterium]